MSLRLFVLLPVLFVGMAPVSQAAEGIKDAYLQAMHLAATQHEPQALTLLANAAVSAPLVWKERMQAAAVLIAMRQKRAFMPEFAGRGGLAAALSQRYLQANPAPKANAAWAPALLAALLPGAGHAWLGRFHDAAAAAVLVWPMLLLTLWAWHRRMGPVTVFFALIATWLWSGNIFSAVSLNERDNLDAYMHWWQGLWYASALPGHPW